jgi:uncharacterized protein YebE (UPF0316 family)
MDLWFSAPIGALLIFMLRVVDVSMAMMRMILAVKGHRGLAAIIGFFEVLIWLVAVGHALNHLDSWFHIVGYAGGFATGNYVGVWLEGRFAMGMSVVQAIFKSTDRENAGPVAANVLRDRGFAVTEVEGRGKEGPVTILSAIIPRRKVPEVMNLVQKVDARAFVTVEEIRSSFGGYIRPGGRKMPFLTANWSRPPVLVNGPDNAPFESEGSAEKERAVMEKEKVPA